jgi:hypothetical protein
MSEDGWHPIKEAPKDGSWVLCNAHGWERPAFRYWTELWSLNRAIWYRGEGDPEQQAAHQPTHYAKLEPMPEPTPEIAKRLEAERWLERLEDARFYYGGSCSNPDKVATILKNTGSLGELAQSRADAIQAFAKAFREAIADAERVVAVFTSEPRDAL